MEETGAVTAFPLEAQLLTASSPAGLVIFIVLAVLAFWLIRSEGWDAFVRKHKWVSRTAVFFGLLVLVGSGIFVSMLAFSMVPVRIMMESPVLASVDSKMGLAVRLEDYEEHKVLPETAALRACVNALAKEAFKKHAEGCGKNVPCLENLPVLSRNEIGEKIKETRLRNIEPFVRLCKDVDETKL